MSDHINGGCDLFPDGSDGKVHAGHQYHGLKTRNDVTGCIGMHGCQRAIMPRIHCLQHIERFAATTLADDDAVRPHAERISHQIANGDGTSALNIRGSGLKPNDMILGESQFGGIFNRDNAICCGEVAAEHIQKCGLSRACAAGYHNVLAELNADTQKVCPAFG